MNKISKKIVALVTMAAFVLTLVPMAAFAATKVADPDKSTIQTVDKNAKAYVGDVEKIKIDVNDSTGADVTSGTNSVYVWFEDEQGNVLQLENDRMPTEQEKEKYCFYHSEFPCELHHNISVYDYHPKGVQKLLIKLPIIGDKIKKKLGKTFRHIGTFNTRYRSGSDCIVAMVNSGDFTLEQAIWVYANSLLSF